MQSSINLIKRVREQKALAKRNRSVKNWGLFCSLILGGVCWSIWYFASPASFPALKIRFPVCIALSILLYYLWLLRYGRSMIAQEAACPQCGKNWEIKEGRGVLASEVMTNWDKCPGCGLLMTEALLIKQLGAESVRQ